MNTTVGKSGLELLLLIDEVIFKQTQTFGLELDGSSLFPLCHTCFWNMPTITLFLCEVFIKFVISMILSRYGCWVLESLTKISKIISHSKLKIDHGTLKQNYVS